MQRHIAQAGGFGYGKSHHKGLQAIRRSTGTRVRGAAHKMPKELLGSASMTRPINQQIYGVSTWTAHQ